MANGINNSEPALLRGLISGFLRSKEKRRAPLLRALSRLKNSGFHSVVFGGTLRDLMVHGPRVVPRDLDIVIDGISVERLSQLFSDFAQRRTRFGGLSVNVRGWVVDIWPLSETWAFRTSNIAGRDFEALTRTTFLNVEAVSVDLTSRLGRARTVYSSGFFEGVRSRTIDINLEENPFPQLAAVRALVTAGSLKYSISTRLARYLVHHLSRNPLEYLVDVQMSHYGRTRLSVQALHRYRDVLHDQLASGLEIKLPITDPVQLPLFEGKSDRTIAA